jgi:hypothetical protein
VAVVFVLRTSSSSRRSSGACHLSVPPDLKVEEFLIVELIVVARPKSARNALRDREINMLTCSNVVRLIVHSESAKHILP